MPTGAGAHRCSRSGGRTLGNNRFERAPEYDFKTPVFLAMACGILLNAFQVPLPGFVMVPAHYIADALVAVALVTLGAQVANLRLNRFNPHVAASLVVRLLVGPAIAFGLIALFRLDGVFAYALLISSCMPTSVNSSIIAQVYNNEPEFAAETVFMSTLASALTVSLVIYLGQLAFL